MASSTLSMLCAGSPHAHEHDLAHLAPGPGQRHLGDDLGAAKLAQQTAAPGHAEAAADGAADLARHAQAVALQQHAFHRLTVGQLHQEARGAVGTAMLGSDPRQRCQLRGQCRQRDTQRLREKILGGDGPAIERPPLRPGAQDALLVAGLGAGTAQGLPDLVDTHGWRC
jgi:hypothetical protein